MFELQVEYFKQVTRPFKNHIDYYGKIIGADDQAQLRAL